MLLECVCCAWLIRTRIIVRPVSFHPHLPGFDNPSFSRSSCINYSSKCQGVEHFNLQGDYCRPKFVCGLTFLTLCLIPERWMGLRGRLPQNIFSLLLAGLCWNFLHKCVCVFCVVCVYVYFVYSLRGQTFSHYEQKTVKGGRFWKNFVAHCFQLTVNFLSPMCLVQYFE